MLVAEDVEVCPKTLELLLHGIRMTKFGWEGAISAMVLCQYAYRPKPLRHGREPTMLSAFTQRTPEAPGWKLSSRGVARICLT